MFSTQEKRKISDAVQKILRETNHPELPKKNVKFLLHVDGAKPWSWADIRDSSSVTELNRISIDDNFLPRTKDTFRSSFGRRNELITRAESNREELRGLDIEELQSRTNASLRANFATGEEVSLVRTGVKPSFDGSGLA